MLNKLLKTDLRKNLRWLWILFACTIVCAGITKACNELGKTMAFFGIVNIFFDSLFYALVANSIIQPFIRNFFDFAKTLYGDEAYLTHTLPVTKNQIINSKYLTAIIEILLGFICAFISILIKFASPTLLTSLKQMLSMFIVGEFSVIFVIILIIILIIVEFLMYISIIYFSIIMAYKSNEKKVLKAFLITALMAILSLTFLSIVLIIVFIANGIDLSAETLVLSSSMFMNIVIAGIITYLLITTLFYFLAKKEFNKGVNVD